MTDSALPEPADGQFVGRVAVITGASRGLGAGLAQRFAEHGMRLGLCARRMPAVPTGSNPGDVLCRSVDVTDASAVDGFAAEVTDAFGPITVWVNNAGVLGPVGPQRDHDPDEVTRALLINIGGVTNGTRSFTRLACHWPTGPDHPRLLANISSGAGQSVYEGWSIYGATKAAVDQFTRTVAAEEPHLICRAVAPGVVDTDMQSTVRTLSEEAFPMVGRFHQLKADNAFNPPDWVADHLLALLTGTVGQDAVFYRVPDHPGA